MQTRVGLPRLVSYAGDRLADGARGRHRQFASVARENMTSGHQALRLDLEAFDGRIDIARGAACGRLLAQHVPGLQRGANFDIDAAALDAAVQRKAEFALRLEPDRIDGVSRAREIGEHPKKVFPD